VIDGVKARQVSSSLVKFCQAMSSSALDGAAESSTRSTACGASRARSAWRWPAAGRLRHSHIFWSRINVLWSGGSGLAGNTNSLLTAEGRYYGPVTVMAGHTAKSEIMAESKMCESRRAGRRESGGGHWAGRDGIRSRKKDSTYSDYQNSFFARNDAQSASARQARSAGEIVPAALRRQVLDSRRILAGEIRSLALDLERRL
jgi:hypothetical protein